MDQFTNYLYDITYHILEEAGDSYSDDEIISMIEKNDEALFEYFSKNLSPKEAANRIISKLPEKNKRKNSNNSLKYFTGKVKDVDSKSEISIQAIMN